MLRRHIRAALIFLALTLLLTNPLVLHLWNAVEDKQDALLNTWILAWVGHILTVNPLNFFDANIFYPYQNTLAYSEILLPQGLIALPLTLATNNPILSYNVTLLAMLWLNAFGMYLLMLDVTRRQEAAWIAGAIFAFSPFNLGNFAQLQLVSLGWLPLALLFLRRMLKTLERPDGHPFRNLIPFTLFVILESLSSFYYALLTQLAIVIYLAWWLYSIRAQLRTVARRLVVPLLVYAVILVLVLTPFLLPYFSVQRELGFQRRVEESEPFSAALQQFAQVSPQNVVYASALAPNPVIRVGGYPIDDLFPGIVALALAGVGVFSSKGAREKWFFVSLLAGSFVLALGPRLYLTHQQATDVVLPYRWLYEIFSPLRALRAPVRFDVLINFALAGLAGIGAAALLSRFSSKRATLVAFGALGLIALEYLSLPAANITPLAVASEIPPVYQWLTAQPHGVALELPMMGPNSEGELDISNQYFSTYHWQSTPDGYSGFIPPRRGEVAYEMEHFGARAVSLLQALDVKHLIVHFDALLADQAKAIRNTLAATPSVKEEKQFGDTVVYAIPPATHEPPLLNKRLYIPSSVAAGVPFTGYMVLYNGAPLPYAVKPTDRGSADVVWSDGRREHVSLPIPLVTSRGSVVPIPLTAPARTGDFELRVQAIDPIIGRTDAGATVHVTNERAPEVVIPAGVSLQKPLSSAATRGDTLQINLEWLPYNKIDAYYSASVRLVNEDGDKVSNVDRQPAIPTLLWQPDVPVTDSFELPIPQDIPPGTYHVQVLMYQADSGEDVLLLDPDFRPRVVTELGTIQVTP